MLEHPALPLLDASRDQVRASVAELAGAITAQSEPFAIEQELVDGIASFEAVVGDLPDGISTFVDAMGDQPAPVAGELLAGAALFGHGAAGRRCPGSARPAPGLRARARAGSP